MGKPSSGSHFNDKRNNDKFYQRGKVCDNGDVDPSRKHMVLGSKNNSNQRINRTGAVASFNEKDDDIDEDDDDEAYEFDPESLLLPRPPAGFILDRDGTTVSLMAPPNKRITTIVGSFSIFAFSITYYSGSG